MASAQTRAMGYAREGARWTGRALQAIAAAASRFDAATFGHRRKILLLLGGALVIAQIVTATVGSAKLEIFIGTALLLVLAAYGLARVQDFRDESGRFTIRLVVGNLSPSVSKVVAFT
ncbi:MAG: hypothetical protein IPK80_28690 [Nannocystis sp.]|nr:hypothetical protein [Nannocystis sp.]